MRPGPPFGGKLSDEGVDPSNPAPRWGASRLTEPLPPKVPTALSQRAVGAASFRKCSDLNHTAPHDCHGTVILWGWGMLTAPRTSPSGSDRLAILWPGAGGRGRHFGPSIFPWAS